MVDAMIDGHDPTGDENVVTDAHVHRRLAHGLRKRLVFR
jgi:hypothetical protein